MVLQAVNKEIRGSKASSLYCVWTKSEGRNGSRLEAVWIDSEMRPFESQFLPGNEDGTAARVVSAAGTEGEGDALSSRAGSEGTQD
jgi:hypothetical protein